MIYAVDFDGYLCENAWPGIGAPHMDIIEHFKRLRADGNKIILWTCREKYRLQEALEWCGSYGLEFDAANENLPEQTELYGNDSRKIGADYYCDDRNYPVQPGWSNHD